MNTIQNFLIGSFFVFTFVITGCSISSDQLDSFRTSNQPMALEDYYWDVNYNNINYRLIAIDLPNGTLFADKNGNSLFFDGWHIDSIVGFGEFNGEFELDQSDNGLPELSKENTYLQGNECGKWNRSFDGEFEIFTQSCLSKTNLTNKLLVNKYGQVIEINQYLQPSNKLMKLKKIN